MTTEDNNSRWHQQLRSLNTKHTHQAEYQTPHYIKHLHQKLPRCLTHYTIGHRGQLYMHYHQTTYPSSPQSTYDMTTDYNKMTDFHQLQESRFCSDHHTHQHTHCQQNFTNIILMTDKHNIPKGKMNSNCRLLPDHIICKITQETT